MICCTRLEHLFIQLILYSENNHLFNIFSIPEEEGETFQVKKSSFSRRIHKERKKNKSYDKESSKNSQNSISNHDNVLKQSSPTSSATKDSFVKEIQSDEGFSVRLLLFNFTFKKILVNIVAPDRYKCCFCII